MAGGRGRESGCARCESSLISDYSSDGDGKKPCRDAGLLCLQIEWWKSAFLSERTGGAERIEIEKSIIYRYD